MAETPDVPTTTEQFTPASILVGVDASAAAEWAGMWALGEAIDQGLALHLVAAAPDPHSRAEAERAVKAVASTVTAAAQRAGRPVTVTVQVAHGQPVAALLATARPAALICVGAPAGGPVSGSTAGELIASAPCPVAVVRRPAGPGWVVAQLDDTTDSAAVLQCAVAQARRRRAPLRVLGLRIASGAQLDQRIATWKRRYPDLDAQPISDPGSGLGYLSAHAASIELVVIGSRDVIAVNELIGPDGAAALPSTSVLVLDRQRLL